MTTFTTEDREIAEIWEMWQERKVKEPLDAYDVAANVQKRWAEIAQSRNNSAMLTKDQSLVPCFVITEYGVDIVRDVYIDPNFGVMIDARLIRQTTEV